MNTSDCGFWSIYYALLLKLDTAKFLEVLDTDELRFQVSDSSQFGVYLRATFFELAEKLKGGRRMTSKAFFGVIDEYAKRFRVNSTTQYAE